MRYLIGVYKSMAKKKGLEYNLTEEQFKELTQKDCYYCGIKPKQIIKWGGGKFGPYIYNGLDRINNDKGYGLDNVVSCCKTCNGAKSKLTLQEFRDWVKRIYNNMYNKKEEVRK